MNLDTKIIVYISKKEQNFKAYVEIPGKKPFKVTIGGKKWKEEPKLQLYKKAIIKKCRNLVTILDEKVKLHEELLNTLQDA